MRIQNATEVQEQRGSNSWPCTLSQWQQAHPSDVNIRNCKQTAEADRQSCFQFKTSIHCNMQEDRCWMILIDCDAVLEASNGPKWQLASEYM